MRAIVISLAVAVCTYVPSAHGDGICGDNLVSLNPAQPSSSDHIAFTVTYPDPDWKFEGATATLVDNELRISYAQTGDAGFLSACEKFVVTVAPLLPGSYVAKVFYRHRYSIDDAYSDPILVASLPFSVAIGSLLPVAVGEFFNRDLNHYFLTADPAEAKTLVEGTQPGWQATGQRFTALSVSAPHYAQTSEVCRFYGSVVPGPNSHFDLNPFLSANDALKIPVREEPGGRGEEGAI